ncbi:MAG: hypothetical protein BroJett025_09900 [Patescibacteria group bacterium]|nr:MAG: hypothetical protein BroJett025_09900 [Patescibacteria group bacterium]
MQLFTLISGSGLLSDPFANGEAVILFGVKSMFIIAGVLYLLFAILVTRQIAMMSKTVSTTASQIIKLLGFIHLIAAILVLIYFFTVL